MIRGKDNKVQKSISSYLKLVTSPMFVEEYPKHPVIPNHPPKFPLITSCRDIIPRCLISSHDDVGA